MAGIFGANVEESLTRCEPEDHDLEYSTDTGGKSLRMKNQ